MAGKGKGMTKARMLTWVGFMVMDVVVIAGAVTEGWGVMTVGILVLAGVVNIAYFGGIALETFKAKGKE